MKRFLSILLLTALCLCLFTGCTALENFQNGIAFIAGVFGGSAGSKAPSSDSLLDVQPGDTAIMPGAVEVLPGEQGDSPAQLDESTVLDYIAVYNSCENGEFGANLDTDTVYHQVFSSMDDMQNGIPPVAVVDESDGRYYNNNDPLGFNGFRVTNFTSADEMMKNLQRYLTEELISVQELNILEYEGSVYVFFGPRGYGAYQLATYGITISEQTDDSCTVYVPALYFGDYDGDATLSFVKEADGWKLDSVVFPNY